MHSFPDFRILNSRYLEHVAIRSAAVKFSFRVNTAWDTKARCRVVLKNKLQWALIMRWDIKRPSVKTRSEPYTGTCLHEAHREISLFSFRSRPQRGDRKHSQSRARHVLARATRRTERFLRVTPHATCPRGGVAARKPLNGREFPWRPSERVAGLHTTTHKRTIMCHYWARETMHAGSPEHARVIMAVRVS